MTVINYQPKKTLRWSLKMSSVVLLIIYAIGTRYYTNVPLPSDFLGYSYFISAYLGHFGFLAILAWLFIALPISLIIPNQWLARALITLAAISIVVLVLLDTFVFQQYHYHLNSFVWALVVNNGKNDIFTFSVMMQSIAVATIAIILIVMFWINRTLWRHNSKPVPAKRTMASIIFVYLIANFIHILASAQNLQGVTRYDAGLPIFYPATANGFMSRHGWIDREAQKANAAIKIKSNQSTINYPLKPLTIIPPTQPMNILIVALDCWRSDDMNARNTPNMWAMAQQSTVYEHHFSGGNATQTGIFSLFYGLPGKYWNAMLGNKKAPALMEVMKQQGYEFGIFGSAGLTSPAFNETVFRNVDNLRLYSEGNSPISRDTKTTQDYLAWMQQHQTNKPNTPFFSFIFYDAPHGYSVDKSQPMPFQPDEDMDYLTLTNNTDPTPYHNRYRNAVYQDDMLVGKVMDDLKKRGLLDNTIVVFTGDHGQEFNDNKHNFWGHSSNFTAAQTHVPFIMYWPNKPAKTVEKTTTHFELAPTLLKHALGVTNDEKDYSMGNDLIDVQPKPWRLVSSYHNFAIIDNEQIILSDYNSKLQVYDMHMNKIEKPTLNYAHMAEAMDELSRFYK